jgi:hypothetical protein
MNMRMVLLGVMMSISGWYVASARADEMTNASTVVESAEPSATIPTEALTLAVPAALSTTGADSNPIVDLRTSAVIIRYLIASNRLAELLESHTADQLEALLNNYSPAQMATEVEILRSNVPVVVYFFQKSPEPDVLATLTDIAATYGEAVKFVIVDIAALFYLVEFADITTVPTILFFNNGIEIGRLEGATNQKAIEGFIEDRLDYSEALLSEMEL